MPSTTNLSLPYPLSTDAADVPSDVEALADALDAVVKPSTRGPLSSRPTSSGASPGIAGRFYLATDEGVLYQDTGTGWQAVGAVGANEADPAGRIAPYVGASAPTGWLLCDGARYNNADYTRLAPIIGSLYSLGGDPVGTFRVPDLRGRAAIGAGSGSGLTARALGDTGGTETHTLAASQIPSHTHNGTTASEGAHTHTGTTATEGSHTHGMTTGRGGSFATHESSGASGNSSYYTTATYAANNRLFNSASMTTAAGSAHSHTFTTDAGSAHTHTFTTDNGTGGNGSHPNMPPFHALTHIIRY